MKRLLFFLLISTRSVFGQDVTGSWSGELAVQGTRLPLLFHIAKAGEGYSATLDSPRQGAKGIPIAEARFENGELQLSAPALLLKYTARFTGTDTLQGTFFQGGMSLPLTLHRGAEEPPAPRRPQMPEPPFNYYTEDVTLNNEQEGNVLAGTLAAPNENRDVPIAVMITGSGDQNRDEELFGHKPFLVIADYLARQGVATLRLDDRGVGGSTPGKAGATSADFAGDISAAVNFLAARGYTNIGLIGHSEGGMIAPMVYGINPKVKFMVLLAGPGIPIAELMRLQTYEVTKSAGVSETQAMAAAETNMRLYRFINSYGGNDLEAELRKFLRKENPGMPEAQLEATVQQVAHPWFRYFLAFDPDRYLSKVKVPVLALNGSRDVQVTAKENLEGIRNSLERAGNKNVEVVEFPGLNHLFQTAQTGAVTEYGELEETIAPAVLEKMGSWILNLR